MVKVDDRPWLGGPLTVDAGSHTVTVAAKGYKTFTDTLSLCNEERKVAYELQLEDAPPPPGAAPADASKQGKGTAGTKDDDDEDDEPSKAPAKKKGGAKDEDDDDDDGPAPIKGKKGDGKLGDGSASKPPTEADPAPAAPPPAAPPPAGAGTPSAAPPPAEGKDAAAKAPAPPKYKGTRKQRRKLHYWELAESDWLKVADKWEASKTLPWITVGWILGRRPHLRQVDSVERGSREQVKFEQYRVKEREGTYAYLAFCGLGATCNEIAKAFDFMYPGIGKPQVECGSLPPTLENPFTPAIPIPTAEEIKKRNEEWLATHGGAGDDDKDDKDEKDDKEDDDDDDD